MSATIKVGNANQKSVLFAVAAALRILLVLGFPGLPDLLTGRVEVSTPVNSFKRLQEGVFLYERGLDPYDGGIFHQAPLLLPIFSLLPASSTWRGRIISVLLYTGLDVLVGDNLYEIAASGAAHTSRLYASPRRSLSWSPISVAATYLLNPFTILSCLGRPTTVFSVFFVTLGIKEACRAKNITAAFALAMASYISLHPILLLPPVGMVCYDRLCLKATSEGGESDAQGKATALDQRNQPSALAFGLRLFGAFAVSVAFLFGLSRFLLPSWSFIPSVYLTPLTLPDLTPNPGLWWYFFIEMFDAFRSFFLGLFWLHMLSYSVPFCLRFRKQPLAAVVFMMGTIAIFEPYADIADEGAWLSSLTLLSHTFELASTHRYTFPALAALLYTTLLGPAFHHLWIYAGSGNANFFYAITLVWALALLILMTDTVYSVLRDEWETERPEGKGKEVRQI
ncbi:GPI transamidase-like protein component PIG-U [Hortaea werneckii]|nr:GPI transamidase-like protein component PIG-U [Hortaea werneckii]